MQVIAKVAHTIANISGIYTMLPFAKQSKAKEVNEGAELIAAANSSSQ